MLFKKKIKQAKMVVDQADNITQSNASLIRGEKL